LAAEIEQALPRKKDQRPTRGAILVNGEFGRRLVRQAARFGLRPRVVTWDWGRPWNLAEVEAALDDEPPGSWIWGVHLESSTGVLNDLEGLVRVAQQRGVRVCADCISSLGAVDLDLAGVYLASGAAGKSLGAYAGIAMVFAGAPGMPRLNHSRLPSYLDLPEMLAAVGPRYTFASPTFAALEAALVDYASQSSAAARYKRYAELGACLRGGLREVGIAPLADEAIASGVLTTFAPPGGESAESFVERAAAAGFDIGGQSEYLTRRRLVQVATMGATTCDDVAAFISYLSGRALPTRPQAQRIGARQSEARAVSRS
jgi:aspartate aminotransferase-like enzyme